MLIGNIQLSAIPSIHLFIHACMSMLSWPGPTQGPYDTRLHRAPDVYYMYSR